MAQILFFAFPTNPFRESHAIKITPYHQDQKKSHCLNTLNNIQLILQANAYSEKPLKCFKILADAILTLTPHGNCNINIDS